MSVRNDSVLHVSHFSSGRVPGQRAGGGGDREYWLIPSTTSDVCIPASYLLSLSFSFFGDNMALLLPDSTNHHSLTLSFYTSQRELEGLHYLFIFSLFLRREKTSKVLLRYLIIKDK